uniref:Helicase ATP-binding domain-containing protein n=1 Tax=Magallana gigas TaxID=29159 RepID=A0A8W8MHU3_MAGGI
MEFKSNLIIFLLLLGGYTEKGPTTASISMAKTTTQTTSLPQKTTSTTTTPLATSTSPSTTSATTTASAFKTNGANDYMVLPSVQREVAGVEIYFREGPSLSSAPVFNVYLGDVFYMFIRYTGSYHVIKPVECKAYAGVVIDKNVTSMVLWNSVRDSSEDIDIINGNFQFLFASPESILSVNKWRDMLVASKHFKLFVVDEAHTVLHWGESEMEMEPFRIWYSKLGEIRSLIQCPVLLITATANRSARMEMQKKFCMIDCHEIIQNPDRENIKLMKLGHIIKHVDMFHSQSPDTVKEKIKEDMSVESDSDNSADDMFDDDSD